MRRRSEYLPPTTSCSRDGIQVSHPRIDGCRHPPLPVFTNPSSSPRRSTKDVQTSLTPIYHSTMIARVCCASGRGIHGVAPRSRSRPSSGSRLLTVHCRANPSCFGGRSILTPQLARRPLQLAPGHPHAPPMIVHVPCSSAFGPPDLGKPPRCAPCRWSLPPLSPPVPLQSFPAATILFEQGS